MPENHLPSKYKLIKLLSDGPYSKVYHAQDTWTGHSVAIKALLHGQPKQNLLEIQAMNRLSHRHVIKLVEVLAAAGGDQVYIVTEFAKCGDLFEKISANRGSRFNEDLSRHYIQQLISAVKHCHSRGVIHRDIKPENLLLDEKWNLKLSDFGLCAINNDDDDRRRPEELKLRDPCGTLGYAAPEIMAGKDYEGTKVDVWSCGVVLYVLSAGFLPFDIDGNVEEMLRKMKRREFRLPNWMSPGLKRLIFRILDPNPDSRITIDEILEDDWFSEGYSDENDLEDCG